MTKKEFIKKWAELIADMAEGAEIERDDVDLGVGFSMVIAMAVRAYKGENEACLELLDRVSVEFDMDDLIRDAKALYPRRF